MYNMLLEISSELDSIKAMLEKSEYWRIKGFLSVLNLHIKPQIDVLQTKSWEIKDQQPNWTKVLNL